MLSVVCPVYNEAENIGNVMRELQSKVSVPMELLLVYDRDDDTTIPVATSLAPGYRFKTRLLKNTFSPGLLNATKTGFMESQGEAVLVIMADLSDDYSVVDEMYRRVTVEGFDVVCGSRSMPGGVQKGGSFFKKFFSRSIGLSLHHLAGIPTHDVTNSFKMYRTSFLNNTRIESKGGFELAMELIVKAHISGYRITELPATWRDRTAGKSRFQMWKWAPSYFRWYFYAYRRRKRR